MKKFLFVLLIAILLLASTYCYMIRPLTEQIGETFGPILPKEANIFAHLEQDDDQKTYYIPFISGAIIAGVLSLMLIFSGTYKIAEKSTDNKALVVAGVAYLILTLILVGLVYGLDLML